MNVAISDLCGAVARAHRRQSFGRGLLRVRGSRGARYNQDEVEKVTIAVKAVYENGVFKPKEPVALEERTEVEVLIPAPEPAPEDDPTGWKAIDALVGSVRSGLTDVSERHDECLYGNPRD